MICGICKRPWEDDKCHVLKLTAAEKDFARKNTGEAPDRYIYCGPCWKLLANRQQGAQFIAGSFRAAVAGAGSEKAEKAARKMLAFLIEKSGKPVS